MAKILILAGDAAESLEVLYPYQRLREEGYEVHIAAPSVKKLRFVVHDFEEGFDTYTEKPGYSWMADVAFKDVKPEEYVALVIPGGRAPEYIRNDPDCQRIIRHFFEQEEAGRAPLPRAARARRGRRAQGAQDRGVSGARAGRPRGRSRVRGRRGGGGRPDGVGPSLAGPPAVDARVHRHPADQGPVLSSSLAARPGRAPASARRPARDRGNRVA